MYGWLEIRGELKSVMDRCPFHAFVHVLSKVPNEMVVDYLQHYLSAGTREECELHPTRQDIRNIACAALTYRYLRPRGPMLERNRTEWQVAAPLQLGPKVFADDLIEVWGIPGSSAQSVFGE